MWSVHELQNLFHRDTITPAKRSTSVFLGFVGLLLLMGALAVDSGWQLRNIASDSAALRREYRDRDELLDELRTNAYRASTPMRDYLLASDEAAAAGHRAELEQLQGRNLAILRQYQGMALPSEQDTARDLSRSVEKYWQVLAPALNWSAAMRNSHGAAFLRESIIPHRNELISLMNQLNKIAQRDTEAGEERVQALHSRFQRRVTAISLLAFILGVGLAIAIVLHVRRLERDGIRRLNDLQVARLDLRRLSDRLVTAQEEERRNLSRELHDEVGQSMSAMLMEFGRLESKLAGVEAYREELTSVRELAQGSVGKVRDLSLLLRPAMLDELGLVPALRWQVREVGRRTGLKVTMLADEAEGELPDAYKTCIYRVVQEALHNCVKHARASHVRVVMSRQEDGLSISIQDDGVGFDAKHEKGLGLLGIAERVGRLGGRFHVESKPGSGAVASIHFPLSAKSAHAIEESVA
jgi:signal transduction histidine kinase